MVPKSPTAAPEPRRRWLRDQSRSRLRNQREAPMPIMPFLNGRQFDPEALRILGLAFDQVCSALQAKTSDDDVRQEIANKVIELRKLRAVLIYYASGFWRTFA